MKNVLIVEDHPLVSESTKDLLLKIDASLNVFIASSAQSAIEIFKTENLWYRIFIDLDLPGAYGLTLARTLHKLGASKITTIVTASNNPEWRTEAQQMGMLGYIVKAVSHSIYITSLNSVLAGQYAFPDTEQTSAKAATQLSRRQLDVLSLMHRGLATKAIARQLNVTEGHVNNVCQTIKSALRANSRSHAISKAIELGYINVHDYQ